MRGTAAALAMGAWLAVTGCAAEAQVSGNSLTFASWGGAYARS